jgi:hypothetical protein
LLSEPYPADLEHDMKEASSDSFYPAHMLACHDKGLMPVQQNKGHL